MTNEYMRNVAINTIREQQAITSVRDEKENLVYLMGFNDGVITLLDNLTFEEVKENEDKE